MYDNPLIFIIISGACFLLLILLVSWLELRTQTKNLQLVASNNTDAKLTRGKLLFSIPPQVEFTLNNHRCVLGRAISSSFKTQIEHATSIPRGYELVIKKVVKSQALPPDVSENFDNFSSSIFIRTSQEDVVTILKSSQVARECIAKLLADGAALRVGHDAKMRLINYYDTRRTDPQIVQETFNLLLKVAELFDNNETIS